MYLDPDYYEKSLFNALKNTDVIVVFSFGVKTGGITLKTVHALISEFSNDAPGSEPAKLVRKALYSYIMKLNNQIQINDDESTVDNDTEYLDQEQLIESQSDDGDDYETAMSHIDEEIELSEEETDDSIETPIDTTVTKNEVINGLRDYAGNISSKIADSVSSGIISKTVSKNLLKALENQKTQESTYVGMKVSEALDSDLDNNIVDPKETIVSPDYLGLGTESVKVTTKVLTKKYIKEKYKKDILRSVYGGLQNKGHIVLEHSVVEEENILGGIETHTVVASTIKGNRFTFKFNLYKISEDGTFMSGGNSYALRRQKSDLPIKKIDGTTVSLSSDYGKLFVRRVDGKRNDVGYAIYNELLRRQRDGELTNVVSTTTDTLGLNLPRYYEYISRYVGSYKSRDDVYCFDYVNRYRILGIDQKTGEIFEKKNSVVFYKSGDKIGSVGSDGIVRIYEDKAIIDSVDFTDFLGLKDLTLPIEYIFTEIYSQKLPIVFLLLYTLGFKKTMSLMGVKYMYTPKLDRGLDKSKFIIVSLEDTYLVIDRDYGFSDLILGGFKLMSRGTGMISRDSLEGVHIGRVLSTTLNIQAGVLAEVKNVMDMFVDPRTEAILKELKQPTTISGLFIRSAELLVDANYKNPFDISTFYFRGYDRVAGMLYRELATAVKDYSTKERFKNAKFSLAPYSVTSKVDQDSSKVLIDDLNPLSLIKQLEDTTYLGAGGRTAISMNIDTRAMDPSEIGIISEANKDNGDVGLSSFLTGSPMMNDLRGLVSEPELSSISQANIYSTPGLMAPFVNKDDPKRASFSNIMASHIVPIDNAVIPFVTTGYDNTMAMKAGEKFAVYAKMNGRVTGLKTTGIDVTYEDGSKDSFSLGEWTSKEESGVCYTHNKVANVKGIGHAFKMGDCIAYDSLFFAPDIFDKTKLVYKSSTNLRIAKVIDRTTLEDSISFSDEVLTKLATTVTKTKSYIIKATDNLVSVLHVGEKVNPDTSLFVLLPDSYSDDIGLDELSLETLKNIASTSPKAKVLGTINDVSIRYNCEKSDMSKTIRKLVNKSDSDTIDKTTFTGRVDNSYSVDGRRLEAGEVELKFYIKVYEHMGHSDKAIVGNQLKCTVGDIFSEDRTTISGKPIDGLFCAVAEGARIVESANLLGTTGLLCDGITELALAKFFKK
jgi:hypothetical protein